MTFENCVVLVVDDEPLVALMVEDMLQEMGSTIAAVVHTEPSAHQALAAHQPNLAILDFELGKSNSLALVAECERRGIGVILATGYGAGDLPPQCQHLPILTKPFTFEQLMQAMRHAVTGSATA